MPNIEIHGLRPVCAHQLRQKIAKALEKESYAAEIVFTTYKNQVIDMEGVEQPYLRIASSNDDFMLRIVELLKPLGIDIEYLRIEAFSSRELNGKNDLACGYEE